MTDNEILERLTDIFHDILDDETIVLHREIVPSLACFNTNAICASLNFDLFITHSIAWPSILNWNFPAQRKRAAGQRHSN